jgi:hypothetical protein
MNHPELAGHTAMPQSEDSDASQGRERTEACMKLLLERFPYVQALVVKRCEKQESFRELCEEYWACSEALARLERPGAEEGLRSEYGALRLRLEGELLRYIAEQSARAGTPHP